MRRPAVFFRRDGTGPKVRSSALIRTGRRMTFCRRRNAAPIYSIRPQQRPRRKPPEVTEKKKNQRENGVSADEVINLTTGKNLPLVKTPEQPSLFEPLEETLNLTPEEKENYRTALRTIDDGTAWVLKQSLTLMSYNFFTASKEPGKEMLHIDTTNFRLTFTPSFHGAPTLYDADILLYAASALAENIRRNKNELAATGTLPYKTDVVFRVKDFFNRIGRSRNARRLSQLQASLDRLANSFITIEAHGKIGTTKIRAGQSVGHFLDGYKFVEIQEEGKAPVAAIQVRLAEWVVRDIISGNMLWFPDDYFRLSPVEKMIFMAVRGRIGVKYMTRMNDKGETEQLPLSLEELDHEPNRDEGFSLSAHTKIDYFYCAMTLPEFAEAVRFKQPLKKLKALLLDIMRDGAFPVYEIAIDESKRVLAKNVVYFFRNDSKLKVNLLAAEIKYPDFKQIYERLTTRAKLLEKEAKTGKKRKTRAGASEKKAPTPTSKPRPRSGSSLLRKRPEKKTTAEAVPQNAVLEFAEDLDPAALFAAEVAAFERSE